MLGRQGEVFGQKREVLDSDSPYAYALSERVLFEHFVFVYLRTVDPNVISLQKTKREDDFIDTTSIF